MSHYPVAVFTQERPTGMLLEKVLIPYWEGDGSQDENTPYFEFVKDGRYGHYSNPNAKWDWYNIGGRWTNMLKVKDNCGDYFSNGKKDGWGDSCPVSCIDFDGMKKAIIEELQPYEEFLTMHLCPEKLRKKYPTEEFYIETMSAFSTYAVITPDGEWIAPGVMGWWGFSSESEEGRVNWRRKFYKFFEMYQDCYITIIDCHI